jgi:hypothetical protein
MPISYFRLQCRLNQHIYVAVAIVGVCFGGREGKHVALNSVLRYGKSPRVNGYRFTDGIEWRSKIYGIAKSMSFVMGG